MHCPLHFAVAVAGVSAAALTTAAIALAAVVAVASAADNDASHEHAATTARTTFTVRIENVSTPTTLRSSAGATAPAPNSPGLWVVHTGTDVVFTEGKLDRGAGLEAQAEDGDPAKLAASVKRAKGVVASGVFDTPVGGAKAGPALPGDAYQFTFQARPGERLTLATMFGQSNDVFYAPDDQGIPLFVNGKPIEGDITSRLSLWDAGTEVNEEPGFGPNQAPRQPAPSTGVAERAPVRRAADVKDGFVYPPVDQVLRVTITPGAAPAMVN
jgi:hypothetical protein